MKQEDIKQTGLYIWGEIYQNEELIKLEKQGFIHGEKQGKTMNVTTHDLHKSLLKQWRDYIKAYNSENVDDIKITLADLRNVAGCLFLKLQEEQK